MSKSELEVDGELMELIAAIGRSGAPLNGAHDPLWCWDQIYNYPKFVVASKCISQESVELIAVLIMDKNDVEIQKF